MKTTMKMTKKISTLMLAMLICLMTLGVMVSADTADCAEPRAVHDILCDRCGSSNVDYTDVPDTVVDFIKISTSTQCRYNKIKKGTLTCSDCGLGTIDYYYSYSTHPTLIYSETAGGYACPACDYVRY